MSELDIIYQIARKTLTVIMPSGSHDDWLWDRTRRILQNVEHICRLPELADQAIAIDRFCLVAAVYFADSGRVYASGSRKMAVVVPSVEMTNAELCEFSTRAVSEKLAEVVPVVRIDKISKIMIESFNRFTDMTEAMILADGRGLEDMGVTGLLGMLRRQVLEGKAISAMLESWKRKIEYGYWQTRLDEGFRFDAVRMIAQHRFAAIERIMDQLAAENNAADIDEYRTRMQKVK